MELLSGIARITNTWFSFNEKYHLSFGRRRLVLLLLSHSYFKYKMSLLLIYVVRSTWLFVSIALPLQIFDKKVLSRICREISNQLTDNDNLLRRLRGETHIPETPWNKQHHRVSPTEEQQENSVSSESDKFPETRRVDASRTYNAQTIYGDYSWTSWTPFRSLNSNRWIVNALSRTRGYCHREKCRIGGGGVGLSVTIPALTFICNCATYGNRAS